MSYELNALEYEMKAQRYEIGMVGLGVMGRNLLLNMADHGHSVAGYDKDVAQVAALRKAAENPDVRGASVRDGRHLQDLKRRASGARIIWVASCRRYKRSSTWRWLRRPRQI